MTHELPPSTMDQLMAKAREKGRRIISVRDSDVLTRGTEDELICKALRLADEIKVLSDPDLLFPLYDAALVQKPNWIAAWKAVALGAYSSHLGIDVDLLENNPNKLYQEICAEIDTVASRLEDSYETYLERWKGKQKLATDLDFSNEESVNIQVGQHAFREFNFQAYCPGAKYGIEWLNAAITVIERAKSEKA